VADHDAPSVLRLEQLGTGRYRAGHPEVPIEGRAVLYAGQLLAQMMLASAAALDCGLAVRSAHAVFARAGDVATPVELAVEPLHRGRSFASATVSAVQGDRELARAVVLHSSRDADLMRHDPPAPSGLTPPEQLTAGGGMVFPGAELRPLPVEVGSGAPVGRFWHRYHATVVDEVAAQAIVAFATCGQAIAVAMAPHADAVRIEDAHRTLSTGVIAQTVHFVDRFDVADWLLVETEAPKAALGRVFGRGQVFDRQGRLVAAFEQDALAKAADGVLDPNRAL